MLVREVFLLNIAAARCLIRSVPRESLALYAITYSVEREYSFESVEEGLKRTCESISGRAGCSRRLQPKAFDFLSLISSRRRSRRIRVVSIHLTTRHSALFDSPIGKKGRKRRTLSCQSSSLGLGEKSSRPTKRYRL